MDSSTSLVDSTGLSCSKSAMALDLSHLDSLLRSNPAQLSVSQGKNVAASVLKQVTPPTPAPVSNSTASCSNGAPSLAVGGVPVSTSVEDNIAPVATASKSTWALVVTDSTPILQSLDFVQPILVSDSSAIRIPTDVIELGRKKYSICLVGQFMGNAPRMGLIHAMFNKLWGRDENIVVVPYKSDLFLIQFSTKSSLSRALYGGPWHVGGIPLHLRLWDSKIQKTLEGLSILGSALGKPLHMDQDCTRLLRLDRINLCVEVNFSKPLLHQLNVEFDDESCAIPVSYSWKPQQCTLYRSWGHHHLSCATKLKTVKWVPKIVPPNPVLTETVLLTQASNDPIVVVVPPTLQAEFNVTQPPNIVEDIVQSAPTEAVSHTVRDVPVISPHSQSRHVSTSVLPALNNSSKLLVSDALSPQKARLIPADKGIAQPKKLTKGLKPVGAEFYSLTETSASPSSCRLQRPYTTTNMSIRNHSSIHDDAANGGTTVEDNHLQELLLTLPRDKNMDGAPLYLYKGEWFPDYTLSAAISFQKHFTAHDTDVIVASMPKSGTTWLKALTFSVVNRNLYSPKESPLLTSLPHDLVRFFETDLYLEDKNPNLDNFPAPRIFGTHTHYPSLPQSIKDSRCKIVYICRNPLDQAVSDFLFSLKYINRKNLDPVSSIDEGFENLCRGVQMFGPIWDSVLGYWKASLERPEKVMFLKYEDLKEDVIFNLKRLAEFLGIPFTQEEEKQGVIEEIERLCSFENLKSLEVNNTGVRTHSGAPHSAFFRKGEVGDWANHLTPAMAERFRIVMEAKLAGSGLSFKTVS
ncbi:hypothetical protein Tsubulata_039880 [Turnera subulata]|uniref:Sulfotransferase n=1 Tax=Turnera subulata TaxID=218843 RepID=A0A9Q0JHX9_9ROSI|nr:hypothetical protein Tsubulata_039880 [Turnera subulata]